MRSSVLVALTAGVVAATALLPPTGRAQSAALGLAGGATMPLGTYGDDKNIGFHLGLVLNVRMPSTPIGFRIDGTFSELRYSGSSTREQIWMANANLVLRAHSVSMVTPYAIGGVGVYNRRRTLLLGNNSSTTLGFNAGAGLRFGLGQAHTFLEVRFHRAGGDSNVRIVPITFGVSF